MSSEQVHHMPEKKRESQDHKCDLLTKPITKMPRMDNERNADTMTKWRSSHKREIYALKILVYMIEV